MGLLGRQGQRKGSLAKGAANSSTGDPFRSSERHAVTRLTMLEFRRG